MTEELSVQKQRPSALPYAAFGGALGAGGAYFGLPKIDAVNKFMTTPAKYNSYEEILSEADDKFTKAVEEATGEEKTLMEKARDARKAGVEAGTKWDADLKAYQEASKALGTNPEKTAEQLATEFVEKNGTKEEAIKKAQNSFKNDLKKLFEGKRGGKFWTTVAGTAVVGALLFSALRPSGKEA